MWTDIIGDDLALALAHELSLPALGRSLCVCKAWKYLLEAEEIWQHVALKLHKHWPFFLRNTI